MWMSNGKMTVGIEHPEKASKVRFEVLGAENRVGFTAGNGGYDIPR